MLAPPPLINGIVLLFPLSIFDKNDDNSNNNHVPSMVISIKDVVGAPSKFLAISSTDPEGGGGTTTAATAWTPCNKDNNC